MMRIAASSTLSIILHLFKAFNDIHSIHTDSIGYWWPAVEIALKLLANSKWMSEYLTTFIDKVI
jgi:hypothetical protein